MIPDIVLERNKILLTQSASGLGIVPIGSSLLYGVVELISDLSDRYSAGNLVLFDPSGATNLQFDNVSYFLTTEDKLFYKENYAPPS